MRPPRTKIIVYALLLPDFLRTTGSFSIPCQRHAQPPIEILACIHRVKRRSLSTQLVTNHRSFCRVFKSDENESESNIISPCHSLLIHHAALKTRNITTAIQFYSVLFGFTVVCKFRAGPARAAWLELRSENDSNTAVSSCGRLEIIEVPSYMLREQREPPGVTRQRAPNLLELPNVLGYHHIALDVTNQISDLVMTQQSQTINSSCINNKSVVPSLTTWIDGLNKRSVEKFGKTLRMALEPRQQMIGRAVYELAFLYDADGCLVELLNQISTLEQEIDTGWEAWDGQGFVGPS